MPNIETDEWKLAIAIRYVPRKTWEQVECPECNGTGKPRIHFGVDYDDAPDVCQKCFGRGHVDKQVFPVEKKPELPQELIDWITKAYLEYKLK